MRIYLIAAISIVIFASCSTSKNTYRDFNSAKNTKAGNRSSSGLQSVDKYPLWVNTSLYTASSNKNVLPLVDIKDIKTKDADEASPAKKETSAEIARRFKELSKLQRKEFRKAMRESMRRYVMPPSTRKETKRRQLDS